MQYYNAAAGRMFGRPDHEVLGSSLYHLNDELRKFIVANPHIWKMAGEDNTHSFIINETRSGQVCYIEVQPATITAPQYGLSGYTLMCSDVTSQRKVAALIQYQASYDSLTDLPNRRLFKDRLEAALAMGKRPEELIDSVEKIADKMRQALSIPYVIDSHTLHITSSIGVSVFPIASQGSDDIMRQADMAMYRAKEAGRNTLKFYLPSMQQAAEEKLKLLGDLRQGIEQSEFLAYFQSMR